MSMDFFAPGNATNIDLREEMHAVLFGSLDLTSQGKQVLVRRLSDTPCAVCWDPLSAGSRRPDCPYCDGEGYQFTEDIQTMFIARGAAPIYKPGILATGQPLQSMYGYTDPNKATAYCEYYVFPDYERYTLPQHHSYDRMYELKVDLEGNTIYPVIHAAKWKMLSVTPIFGDYGRVEYLELGLEKDNI